jgi:hypothetical protein
MTGASAESILCAQTMEESPTPQEPVVSPAHEEGLDELLSHESEPPLRSIAITAGALGFLLVAGFIFYASRLSTDPVRECSEAVRGIFLAKNASSRVVRMEEWSKWV